MKSNCRAFLVSIVALAILLIGVQQPANANITGMVCFVKGAPELQKKGTSAWRPVRMLQRVYPGDRIRCAADAELIVVILGTGDRYKIVGGQSATITTERIAGATALGGLSGPSNRVARSLAGARVATFLSRAPGQDSRLNKTFLGWVSAEKPVFEWNGVQGAGFYLFTLYDTDDNVILHTRTNALKSDYPEDLPALVQRRPYIWRLSVQDANGKAMPAHTRWGLLTVLNQDSVAELEGQIKPLAEQAKQEPKDTITLSLMSEVYREYRVFMRVLELLEDAGLRLDNPKATLEARRDTYRQLGGLAMHFSGLFQSSDPDDSK